MPVENVQRVEFELLMLGEYIGQIPTIFDNNHLRRLLLKRTKCHSAIYFKHESLRSSSALEAALSTHPAMDPF